MMERKSIVTRTTEKAEVRVVLRIDGSGKSSIQTGIPFLDHMLALFARHGTFHLEVAARSGGSDPGCLLEEVAYCLGLALDKALGDRDGIERSGYAYVPADEALVRAVVDLAGPPSLVFRVRASAASLAAADAGSAEKFWKAFASQARLNLHVELLYGEGGLPVIEAVVRAASRAVSAACRRR